MNPKIIIWAPPYRHTSAGVIVLHRLCHLLNKYGYESYLTTQKKKEDWNTPLLNKYDVLKDIVIYPEIVDGNLNYLCEKRTVRYLLNSPYAWSNNVNFKYKKTDLIVAYEMDFIYKYPTEIFNQENLDNAYHLKLSAIDPKLFYTDKNQKIKDRKIVFFGKLETNLKSFNLQNPERYILLKQDTTKTREETAQLLRSAEEVYSFDPNSSLNTEALLCGCKTYIITQDGQHEYKGVPDTNTPKANSILWDDKKIIKNFVKYLFDYFKV